MKSLISISLKGKKIGINLFFFAVFTSLLFMATPNFYSYFVAEIRYTTSMFLAGVALFFIHNIVLDPILLEEKNTRKYLGITVTCLLVFAFVELFQFSAMMKGQASPNNNILGINPQNLLSLDQFVNILAAISIPLLIIGILSFIYLLAIYGFNRVSIYVEAFVHTLILLSLFILLIFIPEIKSKQIWAFCIVLLVFYTNTFLVTPLLVKNKQKLKYIFGLLALCASYFILHRLLLEVFGYPKFDPETGARFSSENIFRLVFSTLNKLFLIFSLFLSFIYGYVRIKIKAKERIFNLKLGKKESELNLLKSQVNPHFLFNSLNTLYATALSENAEKTGESIAKLASLIRYMQKDIDKDFIPLQNEINYVLDYIAIQKLRCAIEPQIETTFKGIDEHCISPGLIIPFIENAFKYGIDPSQTSTLNVSVICDEDSINFLCVNSYDDTFKTYQKEQGFGIGIKNTRQRLKLVYPKKHSFEIEKKNNIFSVRINIETTKKRK